MAIVLPSVAFRVSYPEFVDQTSVSRSGGRLVSVIEYGPGYCQIAMITKPLRASERLLVEGFRDAARNGLVTVHYTPQHQCLPKAYWGNAGAAAPADNGTLTSVTGYSVTIGSVTNGLVLSTGDLLGFTTGDYNWMARVVTGGTASANSVTVTINRDVPSFIETSAVVRFKDIIANMRMLPGSFQMPDEHLPTASFTLIEVPK